ncbi:hypothetical protein [Streptomyces sp. CA-106131]
MRQIEVSRTLVFDAPRNARTFFDALVSDNLGLGRPDEISYIFDRRIRSDTQTGFATKVVTRGVDVTVNLFYKHSRIKQYLKASGALPGRHDLGKTGCAVRPTSVLLSAGEPASKRDVRVSGAVNCRFERDLQTP